MAICRATVRLNYASDASVGPEATNTWHFDSGVEAITDSMVSATLFDKLGALYHDLEGLWSSLLSGDATLTAYDLSDPTPRLPVFSVDGSIAVETDTLSPEASIKVGHRYARATGVPTQRGRGTLQLGPLAKAALGDDGLLTTATLDQVETALTTFKTAINGSLWTLVTGTEAHGFQPTERFTIDNEVGTVQRRSLLATDQRIITI